MNLKFPMLSRPRLTEDTKFKLKNQQQDPPGKEVVKSMTCRICGVNAIHDDPVVTLGCGCKTKSALRKHLRRSTNDCYIEGTLAEIYRIIEEHEDPLNLAEVVTNLGINLNELNMNTDLYEPMYSRPLASRQNAQLS